AIRITCFIVLLPCEIETSSAGTPALAQPPTAPACPVLAWPIGAPFAILHPKGTSQVVILTLAAEYLGDVRTGCRVGEGGRMRRSRSSRCATGRRSGISQCGINLSVPHRRDPFDPRTQPVVHRSQIKGNERIH